MVDKADKTDLVVMAVLLGAHGVRGDCRIKSFADVEADAFTYGPLMDALGTVLVTAQKVRPAKAHFVVTPKEVRQKEDWDAIKGTLLHVPRELLPETEDDEVYIDELVGARAVDEAGALLGVVKAVHNFGAGDLLEIAPDGGGKTVLVPFTEEDVPGIDLDAGEVEIVTYALWADESGSPEEES